MSGYANTGKKFSIAFIKYFSKLIRQMKGNMFINSNPKRFSQYTLKTIIFLTSQSKHASTSTSTSILSATTIYSQVQLSRQQIHSYSYHANMLLITHEPNEISRYKGQIKVQHLWKSPTSKQVPCK